MTAPGSTRAPRVPRAQRRAQLLDVTLALLAEEGFAALSVEAIARRAGVNRVVVYRSFANLHVLLLALLRREQARVDRQLEAVLAAADPATHPYELLIDGLTRFLAAVEAEPLTWRLALAPPDTAPVALREVVHRRRAAVERRMRPLVAAGVARLPLPPGTLDEEVLSRMLLSFAEEQGRLLLEGGAYTRERLLRAAEGVLAAVPWPPP